MEVSDSLDQRWPSAATLLKRSTPSAPASLALLGVHTYRSSLTERSATSTPAAIRAALERFSTYSWLDDVDLAGRIDVVDYDDVEEPDGPDGLERVRESIANIDRRDSPLLILGGDNAATYAAMTSLAGGSLGDWGLITFDAHLDLRDGWSNGSPVQQLLEAGLNGKYVAQVGVADFSNSAYYAQRSKDAGITVIPRSTVRSMAMGDVVTHALSVAGHGGRPVYVDLDLDVVDRGSVPSCPAAAPGGLTPDELRQATRLLMADGRVRALDITEIDVERDAADQRTVRLAALLLLECCAGVLRRAA